MKSAIFLTYGDGVSDVNIDSLLEFHKKSGKIATMTAIKPEGRFGVLDIDDDHIHAFRKSKNDSGWINGGFMVLQPQIFDYIKGGDEVVFEKAPI